MSIRNVYHPRETYINNSQPYRYKYNSNKINNASGFFSSLPPSEAEDETDISLEKALPNITSSTTEEDYDMNSKRLISTNKVRSTRLLQDFDSDISSEDLRFTAAPSQQLVLQERDVENRQLSYLSLPDLFLLPSSSSSSVNLVSSTIGGSSNTESSRNHEGFSIISSASPSYSIESVTMELEQDIDDILLMEDSNIPTEDVDDETESTLEEDEFVNMRVKVEKKPYPTNAMKVTVSVQPPSEIEDDDEENMDELYDHQSNDDDELLSATSAEIVCSESEVCSESSGDGESSDEVENSSEEIVEEISRSEGSQEEEMSSSGEEEKDDEDEESNNSNDSGGESGQSGVDSEEEAKNMGENKTDKHQISDKTQQPAEEEEPKDETEKMLELLGDAIDDSEKVKVKIAEKVTLAKLQEAEAIAIAEGEKLRLAIATTQSGENKTISSPMVKAKGLGESVVSGVQKAVSGVSSSVNLVKSEVSEVVADTKQGLDKSADKIGQKKQELETAVGGVAATTSIENAKEQAKELDKRIHYQASSIVSGDILNAKETLTKTKLHPVITSSLSTAENLSNAMPVPPANTIVVANVMVHGTPKSSQSPTVSKKPITTTGIGLTTTTTSTASTSSVTTASTQQQIQMQGKASSSSILLTSSNSISQMPVTVPDKSTDVNNSNFMKSSPEKEDYLSVCAADSMDSSEGEEDSILKPGKTKVETEEERRAVELAKDKLMEDWKSTRRESIDELDDKFQHIIEDMVSELHMEPVVAKLPRKLKEAVHVSEESNKPSSSAGSSLDENEQPSESGSREQMRDELLGDNAYTSHTLMPIPEHGFVYSNKTNNNSFERKNSSGSPRGASPNVSGSEQNSVDSQKSLNSASSNSSRKMSSNNKISTPVKIGNNSSPKSSVSSPKTKLSPSQPKRTLSAKSLKMNNSQEPDKRPLSETRKSATPSKSLNRAISTKSLKVSQADPDSKIIPSANPVQETTESSSKSIPSASKIPNPSLSPSKTHITNTTNDKISSPSLSPKGIKSPSLSSQHSSNVDETDMTLGAEEDIDLPNFNSAQYLDSEFGGGGDSDINASSSRDEESPTNRRKWKNSTEIASTLSHYLYLIKTETIENSVTEIIPLLTQLLVKERKGKSEHALPTLIATLSAIRMLCDRLHHVKVLSGEKALRNMDLSWLIRILCKLSASPESKLKPEASFTLAKLVKAAGPELITRPIYFLLVMENDGYGHQKGSQGSKTKAAALDTLTYALLTFPKEEFDDLEEIARWVCLVVMHPHRRVRQAALECISVIGNCLGSPDAAVSRLRNFIVYEAEQNYHKSDSDGSDVAPKSAIKRFDGKGVFDVSAITAISVRVRKRILPLPSPHGLIQYGVKVPTGQELVLILTKMQEEEEEEYEGSTSDDGDSVHSSIGGDDHHHHHHHNHSDSGSDSIRMSDLEKAAKEEKIFGKKPKSNNTAIKVDEDDDVDFITPDVAYVLAGKGRVNKQDVVNLNDDDLNNVNNDDEQAKITCQEDDKEKKRKARLRKKRQKKRHVERTYSEYEDDSPQDE